MAYRRHCKGCGCMFTAERARRIFHSRKCFGAWRKEHRLEQLRAQGRQGAAVRAQTLERTLEARLRRRLGRYATLADAYRLGRREANGAGYNSGRRHGLREGYERAQREIAARSVAWA